VTHYALITVKNFIDFIWVNSLAAFALGLTLLKAQFYALISGGWVSAFLPTPDTAVSTYLGWSVAFTAFLVNGFKLYTMITRWLKNYRAKRKGQRINENDEDLIGE
jgi:membrane protein implicated in regulation of membrane protease activity